MNSETHWAPTRHGGFRRTGVAQKMGTQELEDRGVEAAGSAEPKVKAKWTPGSTLEERRSDMPEVGGSNPSPRTKKFVLKLNERLGLETCPYVVRWRLETPWFSIRLHHWLAPDDDRAPHDHPWSFTTFVIKGGYRDASPAGDEHLRAPAIRHRAATHQHTVFPDPGGAWTILVTGPKTRDWGFWVKGKFRKANKYFLTHGHHPCN